MTIGSTIDCARWVSFIMIPCVGMCSFVFLALVVCLNQVNSVDEEEDLSKVLLNMVSFSYMISRVLVEQTVATWKCLK